MEQKKIRVGITHGDINGISYEVIIKSLMDNRINDTLVPVVYGSPKVAAYHRKALNIGNFSFNSVTSADEINLKRSNMINVLDDSVRVELGKSTPMAGDSSAKSLSAAIRDLKANKFDVLVTAPINKDNIQENNFNFPGHTEYLQNEFNAEDVLMLMASEMLKVGVVIGHSSIAALPGLISREKVYKKIKIMHESLKRDFNIRKPRIAVLGLNPHAGENGLLGEEEIKEIDPAIKQAREEGIIALGSFPADGFFGSGSYKKFDGILAMYHDQGLIPFKTLIGEKGVNFTAGLPIVRTSPAHGTAYEIAGKNEASEESFRNAIYMACDIFRNRTQYDDLNSNAIKEYDISNI